MPTPNAIERYIQALNRGLLTASLRRDGQTLAVPVQPAFAMCVDEADGWLADYSWHSHISGKNTYACTSFGSGLHVPAHAMLARPFPRGAGIDVDHVDGDSLNNRRNNLRYASHAANIARGFEARRRRLREEAQEAEDRLTIERINSLTA